MKSQTPRTTLALGVAIVLLVALAPDPCSNLTAAPAPPRARATQGLATDSPPTLPPVMTGVHVKWPAAQGGTFTCKPALPSEVCVAACDLALATPAGFPLLWSRTYRSRAGTGGLITSGPPGLDCGTNWFAAWDIRIEPVPPDMGANAAAIYLYGGDGRQDVLLRQSDGSYRCDGMFREGWFHADGSFTLTFADRSSMSFCALDGSPDQGRICTLSNRNGVTLTCSYDGAGKLTLVTSQFGQSITCGYDPDGKLSTVTDHTGRFVEYSYYGASEPGGSLGDLKSVSSPQTLGQVPLAGPTTYAYTSGDLDDRLNHNLRSIADGAGRLLEEYEYSPESDPLAIEFDVVSRVRYLGNSEPSVRHLEPLADGYRIFENDPLGRVTESDIDHCQRRVVFRQYTGFSTPGVPVTSISNRPTGKLRATDPDYYETTWVYNDQHLCTQRTLPDGTQYQHTYEFDLNPDCPVRERGNERVTQLRSPTSQVRSVSCEYLPGFGTHELGGHGPTGNEAGPADNPDEFTSVGSVSAGDGEDPVLASNPIPGVGIVVKRNLEPAWARNFQPPQTNGVWSGDDHNPQLASNPIPGVGIVVKRNLPSSAARTFQISDTDGVWTEDDQGPVLASNPIPGVGIVVKRNLPSSAARSLPVFDTEGMLHEDDHEPLLASNPIPGVGIVVKRNFDAIDNLRSRLDSLETVLQKLGILAPALSSAGGGIHPDGGGSGGELSPGNPIGGLTIKGGKNPGGNSGNQRPGNPIGGLTIKGGKNPGGDTGSQRPGNPIGGLTIKGGKNPGGDSGNQRPGNPIGGLTIKGGKNPGGDSGSNQRPGNPIGGLTIKGGKNPGGGFATSLVTTQGQEFTWTYDTNGNCTSYRPPIAGSGCDYSYNTLGQSTACTVRDGAGTAFTDTYSYDATSAWRIGHTHDPAGLSLTRTVDRDELGRIVHSVDARGFDGWTAYDALDRVTRTLSPVVGSGSTASRCACDCFYDAGGLLVRIDIEHRDSTGALDPVNPAYSRFVAYDDRTLLAQRVYVEQRPYQAGPGLLVPPPADDANFAITEFSYDVAGQCVSASIPAVCRGQSSDARCDYIHDERGLLFRRAEGGNGNPSGIVMQYDYDAYGACIRSAQLSSTGLPDLVTNATYDGFHRMTSYTDPMGNVAEFERDAENFTTTSFYGELDDVIGAAENQLLHRAREREGCWKGDRPPNAFFDVVESVDVLTLDRFTPGEPTANAKHTATVHRSPAGLVTSVSQDGDPILTCSYDSAGRLVLSSDGSCSVERTLDASGNVLIERRSDHSTMAMLDETFTTTRDFDSLGRCISSRDGGGNEEHWEFDSLGRWTQYTDAMSVVVRGTWDSEYLDNQGLPRLYRLMLEADSDGDGTCERIRDVLCSGGEYVSETNSHGDTTTYSYDALRRCVQIDHPDGTVETWSPDDYGRLAKHKRKDGAIISCDFNYRGRAAMLTVIGSVNTVPVPPTEYRYTGLGHCVAIDQGESHLTFAYDSLGNQLSDLHNGVGVTRTFDGHGRRSIAYSSGERFLESRDALGRLLAVSVASSNGAPSSPPISRLQYSGHRVALEVRNNGIWSSRDYRSDGEPPLPGAGADSSFDQCVRTTSRNSDGEIVQSTRFRRNPNQWITRSEVYFSGGVRPPGRRRALTFDRLGRLTHVVSSRRAVAGGPFLVESDVSYTLDLEGLRLTAVGGAHPGVYTQDDTIPPGDRQMGQYTMWPDGPLEWDDAGNLTAMSRNTGLQTYLYDALLRLVAVGDANTGTALATYAYDGLGRRIESTLLSMPPVTTGFVYDGAHCFQEIGDDGLPDRTWVCGTGGLAICITSRNGTLVYPHGGGTKDSPGSDSRRSVGAPDTCEATAVYCDSGGVPVERVEIDGASAPTFLDAMGFVRGGATGTLSGYDWFPITDAEGSFNPADWSGRFCPESGFLQSTGGYYSPQLGRATCSVKFKEASRASFRRE